MNTDAIAREMRELLEEWLLDTSRFPMFRQLAQRTRGVVERAKRAGV